MNSGLHPTQKRRSSVQWAFAIARAGLGSILAFGLVATLWIANDTGSAKAAANSPVSANSLDRNLEPVILTGSDVSELLNTPVNELFAYAYTGGTWSQVPVQVDEINTAGDYVASENDLVDGNDEIVIMAKDSGDQAPAGTKLSEVLPVNPTWYEVKITDPTSAAQSAWIYLVQSQQLSPPPEDYVDFIAASHRVAGESYALGYATPNPWADYLTLGNGTVDLLDRNKIRLCATSLCNNGITEESSPITVQDDVIKDGPVRVIVRGGRVKGYGAMLSWSNTVTIPPNLQPFVQTARFAIDFTPAASGSTYYNAVVPTGVTIDGLPDAVAPQPASPWFQVSTDTGTMVFVADTGKLGASLSNYYEDSAVFLANDTGDKLRYGETGTIVSNPPQVISYDFSLYAMDGKQTNVGETYQTYFEQPLAASAVKFSDDASGEKKPVYLPSLMK